MCGQDKTVSPSHCASLPLVRLTFCRGGRSWRMLGCCENKKSTFLPQTDLLRLKKRPRNEKKRRKVQDGWEGKKEAKRMQAPVLNAFEWCRVKSDRHFGSSQQQVSPSKVNYIRIQISADAVYNARIMRRLLQLNCCTLRVGQVSALWLQSMELICSFVQLCKIYKSHASSQIS